MLIIHWIGCIFFIWLLNFPLFYYEIHRINFNGIFILIRESSINSIQILKILVNVFNQNCLDNFYSKHHAIISHENNQCFAQYMRIQFIFVYVGWFFFLIFHGFIFVLFFFFSLLLLLYSIFIARS